MLLWLFWSAGVISDSTWMPVRDSYGYHFNTFRYLVSWIEEFGCLPDWIYHKNGGMWIAPLANNLLIAAPHRLAGLFISAVTPIDATTLYKFSFLIIGNGIFFSGLYLFFKIFFASSSEALFTVGIISVSSLMFGILHQEQALGTILLVPWIWYFIWKLKDNYISFLPIGALMGLSLNFHYPQILFLYWIFVFAVLLISKSYQFIKFPNPGKSVAIIAASFTLMIVCASPVLYSYHTYNGSLISQYRGQLNQIGALSWSAYLEFNHLIFSDVAPKNLLAFLGLQEVCYIEEMDEILLYSHGLIPVALMSLLCRWNRKSLSALVIMGLLAVTCIGTYGPVPFLIWNKLPGMSMFRQWYHVLPLLVLHTFVVTIWFCLRPQEFLPERRYPIVIGIVVLFLYLLAWKNNFVGLRFIIIYCFGFLFMVLMILKKLKPESASLLLCGTLAVAALLNIWTSANKVEVKINPEFIKESNKNNLVSDYFNHSSDPFLEPGINGLVEIKGFTTPKTDMSWEMFKGQNPVNAKVDIELKRGRIRFKNVPGEVDTIRIYQYNDGHWNIPDDAWSIQKEFSYLVLKRNQKADLIISRTYDAWWFLVFLSYGVTLSTLIFFWIRNWRGINNNT